MAEGEVDNDTWRQEAVRMQENPELTTSEIAAQLQKPVKTVANARKKGLNFEKASEKATDTSKIPALSYRIAPIPGKGLGLVATRKICRGELVVEEKPVLTAPGGLIGMRKLQAQFDALEASVQDEIMALHDRNASDGHGKTLLGVFGTNALPQGVGSPDAALCLVISRANHSCISNATMAG